MSCLGNEKLSRPDIALKSKRATCAGCSKQRVLRRVTRNAKVKSLVDLYSETSRSLYEALRVRETSVALNPLRAGDSLTSLQGMRRQPIVANRLVMACSSTNKPTLGRRTSEKLPWKIALPDSPDSRLSAVLSSQICCLLHLWELCFLISRARSISLFYYFIYTFVFTSVFISPRTCWNQNGSKK